MSGERTGVLFVCLGNICRSPLAECVFLDLARRRGVQGQFDVDSCGTGHWHAGGPADPRSVQVASKFGLTLTHTARQLRPETDFERFDLLVAMDRSNRGDLIGAGAPVERVRLMRTFSPESDDERDVPDPYYGPGDGFERVFEILVDACGGLLEQLVRGVAVRRAD